jgi:hypothetical protein
MTQPHFDPTVLAEKLAATLGLTPGDITHHNGVLRFSPGMLGDARTILNAVRALPSDDVTVLVNAADGYGDVLDKGYAAIHQTREPGDERNRSLYKAAAALALMIGRHVLSDHQFARATA